MTLQFSPFFLLKLVFFSKNLILPAERSRFLKKKVAKLLTYGGQVIDPTAYIYIHTHAVKLLTGPSLGVFKVISWSKSKLLTGPRSFSHYKKGVSGDCFAQLSLCVLFLVPNYLAIF